MSPPQSADDRQRASKAQLTVMRYLRLRRTAFALAIGGILAILLGIYCLPSGAANPKALNSFFVVASGAGWFIGVARKLFMMGGILLLAAIVLRVVIDDSYEEYRE